ncbi:MAG: sulfite exporter TauE/SafE family protein [Candidatus Absconditabacterales bacterium]
MKQTLHINGMHCKSCEMLIKNAVNDIDHCIVQSLSHKTGVLIVECPAEQLGAIESAINEAGYTIGQEQKQPRTADQRFEKIAWLLLAAVLLYVLFQINVNALIPQYDTLGFGVALVIGLVASVSTCLAVTGGIVIGYAESVQTQHNLMTQLKFHLGRIVAFVVGGGLLGLLGSQFAGSVRFNAIFSVLVGVVLLYLGLQLLGIVPNITKWGFHLPSGLSQTIFDLKNPRYAPIVGALTFLLPCGFTQSMQLYALQSGDALQGAMIMGAFALGTLPVLLGVGLGTKYIKDKLTWINPLIASLLVVFGSYTVYNGFALTQALTDTGADQTTATTNNLETETVQVGHDGLQFVPSIINLAAGKNYKIVTTPSSDGRGCNTQVVIPGVGPHTIKKGEPFEIVVDGSSPKVVKLVCASMGMEQGKIVIQ